MNADFDLLTVQPDLALASNGFYDALALRNNPSLADLFKVRFVWLGTGTSGSQPFTVYNADFSTQSQGQTTSVPEPSALALLLAALGAFARRRQVGQPPRLPASRAGASPAHGGRGARRTNRQPGRAALLPMT